MLENTLQISNQVFDQIAIADLDSFQILIPTTTQPVNKQIFSTWVSIPERIYADNGWIVYEGESIATLHHLELGAIGTDSSPVKLKPRLGPAVPINFESRSPRSLPSEVRCHAAFACTLIETHTVFRGLQPRFVRIYDCHNRGSLAELVANFLQEESQFIAENRQRLQQLPFYQEQFDL